VIQNPPFNSVPSSVVSFGGIELDHGLSAFPAKSVSAVLLGFLLAIPCQTLQAGDPLFRATEGLFGEVVAAEKGDPSAELSIVERELLPKPLQVAAATTVAFWSPVAAGQSTGTGVRWIAADGSKWCVSMDDSARWVASAETSAGAEAWRLSDQRRQNPSPLGGWNHVALTIDTFARAATLYVDGVPTGTIQLPDSWRVGPASALRVFSPVGHPSDSLPSSVTVYGSSLRPEELFELWKAEVPIGPDEALVGLSPVQLLERFRAMPPEAFIDRRAAAQSARVGLTRAISTGDLDLYPWVSTLRELLPGLRSSVRGDIAAELSARFPDQVAVQAIPDAMRVIEYSELLLACGQWREAQRLVVDWVASHPGALASLAPQEIARMIFHVAQIQGPKAEARELLLAVVDLKLDDPEVTRQFGAGNWAEIVRLAYWAFTPERKKRWAEGLNRAWFNNRDEALRMQVGDVALLLEALRRCDDPTLHTIAAEWVDQRAPIGNLTQLASFVAALGNGDGARPAHDRLRAIFQATPLTPSSFRGREFSKMTLILRTLAGGLNVDGREAWVQRILSGFGTAPSELAGRTFSEMVCFHQVLEELFATRRAAPAIADWIIGTDVWMQLNPNALFDLVTWLPEKSEAGKEAATRIADHIENRLLRGPDGGRSLTPEQWRIAATHLAPHLAERQNQGWLDMLRSGWREELRSVAGLSYGSAANLVFASDRFQPGAGPILAAEWLEAHAGEDLYGKDAGHALDLIDAAFECPTPAWSKFVMFQRIAAIFFNTRGGIIDNGVRGSAERILCRHWNRITDAANDQQTARALFRTYLSQFRGGDQTLPWPSKPEPDRHDPLIREPLRWNADRRNSMVAAYVNGFDRMRSQPASPITDLYQFRVGDSVVSGLGPGNRNRWVTASLIRYYQLPLVRSIPGEFTFRPPFEDYLSTLLEAGSLAGVKELLEAWEAARPDQTARVNQIRQSMGLDEGGDPKSAIQALREEIDDHMLDLTGSRPGGPTKREGTEMRDWLARYREAEQQARCLATALGRSPLLTVAPTATANR